MEQLGGPDAQAARAGQVRLYGGRAGAGAFRRPGAGPAEHRKPGFDGGAQRAPWCCRGQFRARGGDVSCKWPMLGQDLGVQRGQTKPPLRAGSLPPEFSPPNPSIEQARPLPRAVPEAWQGRAAPRQQDSPAAPHTGGPRPRTLGEQGPAAEAGTPPRSGSDPLRPPAWDLHLSAAGARRGPCAPLKR